MGRGAGRSVGDGMRDVVFFALTSISSRPATVSPVTLKMTAPSKTNKEIRAEAPINPFDNFHYGQSDQCLNCHNEH